MFEQWQSENIDKFDFSEDLYWHVPLRELSDLRSDPKLTIGSMNDDIGFLEKLYRENYLSNNLELERLSAVFRFIATGFLKRESSETEAPM